MRSANRINIVSCMRSIYTVCSHREDRTFISFRSVKNVASVRCMGIVRSIKSVRCLEIVRSVRNVENVKSGGSLLSVLSMGRGGVWIVKGVWERVRGV